jgi:hypothetical protein
MMVLSLLSLLHWFSVSSIMDCWDSACYLLCQSICCILAVEWHVLVCISIPWSDIDPSQHILFHVAFSLGSWWEKIGPFLLVQWAKWPLLHMEYCLSFQWTMTCCTCWRTHECPDLYIC